MKNKVRHSLRVSLVDGILAAVTTGLVENFVTPLAIALQATASQIAALAATPNLVAASLQLQAGPLRNLFNSRRRIVCWAIGGQVVCLMGLVTVPLWPAGAKIPGLIALMTGFTALGALAGPFWSSLMCEYLPLSRRSGYFGWRARLLGGVTIAATLMAGIVLQVSGRQALWGFFLIFAVAAVARLVSLRYLNQMFDPPSHEDHAAEKPSYHSCLTRHRPFLNFLGAAGLMQFSVHLTGPFLSLYMLKDLRLGYGMYVALILAAQVTMYVLMKRWGRNADRAGNMRVVQLTARFLPFTALFWALGTHPLYLLGVQLMSGMVWSGYNLCVANFVYDSVRNRQRVHATALFSAVNGLAAFAGATLGGQLLSWLPPIGGHSYYTLLLIGAAARFLVGWVVYPRLREVREVPHTPDRQLVYNLVRFEAEPGR